MVRAGNDFKHYSSENDDSPMNVKLVNSDDNFEATDENEFLIQSSDSEPSVKKRTIQCADYICCLCNCIQIVITSCLSKMINLCKKKSELKSRTVAVGRSSNEKFPPNVVKNQKYNIFTFIPLVLFNQFKFFLNLYFLIMALSQFVPSLRVGYISTYWGPLIFVLLITMIREAVDDFRRYIRDKEMNSCKYRKLTRNGVLRVPSSAIKVSDLIIVDKNERVPADMVLIRTSEKNGSCFIRTDQLDGETDWKLRLAIESCQRLPNSEALFEMDASIYVEAPQKDIHQFFGTYTRHDGEGAEDALSVENTLWANTVVASGSAVGIVIYSGRETRSVMNNAQPRSKVGLLDIEVNRLTKILFVAVLGLSLVMMLLKGFSGPWPRYFFRFVLLFSYIIPLSLIVNLDLGKVVYSWMIQRDKKIDGTVVRTTTIPEELGRIVYLLSDKTGTLTQNEMIFKRLHLGTVSYGTETFNEVSAHLKTAYAHPVSSSSSTPSHGKPFPRMRRTIVTRIQEAVKALSLCHNVTPVYEDEVVSTSGQSTPQSTELNLESIEVEADQHSQQKYSYQASSPDEVALVTWTESVGMALIKRDITNMQVRTPHGVNYSYTILQTFPFTSETKRMGIIVKEDASEEITFYMKGADVIMSSLVQYNDWLEEECDNMARDGLRTLVVAKKSLTKDQYLEFEKQYNAAKLSKHDRSTKIAAVIETLERDLELLCVTGVEDKLQDGVRTTLELLRNAGIKIWMLTGDKLETATCIAKSSCLVSRTQSIHIFNNVTTRTEAHLELNAFRRKSDCALVITGASLVVCLKYYEHEFMELACQCPAVICCRCSPTQKADVVKLIQVHTGKRTCAIGDGGNDVSMIQAADAGIGIIGKEGKQASLAADFSITQFSFISTLFLVHGRNSYKRSASLSQFIIHRGLIISTMQAVFSSVFYFASVSLYQGFLMVGYATIYTNFPVFSLVLDKDVSSEIALMYPELYKELTKGRSLSLKTFFIWVAISIYQGGIIMYGALLLFEEEFIHIVAISFTSLLLTELLMVALTIRTWHWLMLAAEVISLALYIGSLFLMKGYFDLVFMMSFDFFWKVIVITLVSCLPLYILKFLHKKFAPPSYSKLT